MKSIEITDELYKRLEFVAGCIPQSVETTVYEAILAYVETLEPMFGVLTPSYPKNDKKKAD